MTDIILHGTGEYPIGNPFLAAATVIPMQTPTITWSNPADMNYGTVLGAAQLDATASYTVGGVSVSVPGTFFYTPAAGTILNVGDGQTLSVSFTPTDTADYTTASATATINVISRTVILQPTRTVLTVKPRPAYFGRPITLIATVKDLSRVRGTPGGSVTFLDGTADLRTVTLRHGTASFKTSSLQLGPNTIQAEFTPSPGFAPSTETIIETVRAHRSSTKAIPSPESSLRRATASAALAIRVGEQRRYPLGPIRSRSDPRESA